MNLDIHDLLSIGAMVLAGLSAALGLRRHDAKKHEAKLSARAELGRRYARAAWAIVIQRKTAPSVQRGALLDAFRLADTALDGRRDFTDAQASLFLDEVASEFK